MSGLSIDFLTQLNGPWEMAAPALVDQLFLLQAQIAPIFPLVDGLSATAADNIAIGQSGYLGSAIVQTDGNGSVTLAATQPGPLTFAASQEITPTALTTDTNNYTPTNYATAAIIRLSSTVPVNLTGLHSVTSRQMKLLINIGTKTITMTDEDALSSLGNRFRISGPANLQLKANAAVWIYYDLTSAIWQVGSA